MLLTVPRRYFFCGSLCYLSFVFVFVLQSCLFLATLWSPAVKGLTTWFSCVWCFLGVVLDCIDFDLLLLPYFALTGSFHFRNSAPYWLHFCRLLITFAKGLVQYQDQQDVSKVFDTLIVFMEYFLRMDFKKVSR